MKTFSLILFFIVCSFLSFAQVNLNQGLVAYYPFNGNANDVSGNGINGAVNGAILTADANGIANSAYEFNGTSDFISLPYNNKYNFSPTDSFSISCWIQPYNNPTWINAQAIVVKSPFNTNYQNSQWNFGLYSVNDRAMTGWAANNFLNASTIMKRDACWYNLVVTYKNGIWYLYVNGKLEAQDLSQTHFIIQDGSASSIAFGRKGEASGDYYKGKLDEVRIYNRNLNTAEVDSLFKKNYDKKCWENPCNSWLKTTSYPSAVEVGKIDITGDKLTIEAICNRITQYDDSTVYNMEGDIVAKHDNFSNVNYLLRPNDASITTTNGFFKTPSTCNVDTQKTYHIAMVYDGIFLKFYRNGFLLSQINATGNLIQNNWATRIGLYESQFFKENFLGYINEVRIWDVARTQQELQQHMGDTLPNPITQNGLIAYYTFNNLKNKQGNALYDGKLIGNALINETNPQCILVADSCGIIPTPPINPNCKGVVKLNGQNKINLPAPESKYYNSSGFTWETWFNSSYYDNNNNSIGTRNKLLSSLDIVPAEDILIGFGWVVGAKKKELCFVVDGKENVPFSVANRDNTPCTYFPLGGFIPNTWYHVAGVRDYANNKSLLYVNGILVDTKSNNHPAITRDMTTFMGNYLPIVDSGFAGKMDEIRIWNYPRTATEIQANYDKCLGGNETGLVAYYHSNEGKGSTLKDVSPNANNATLSSSVTWDKTDNAPLKTTCYQSTFSVTNKIICYKDTFQNHTVSGVYKDTITNSYGCDSIITLNLTVLPIPTISKDTVKGCGQVVVNGVVYTTNTLLSSTIKNQLGCDSIIQQHQIIITTKHDTLTKQICSGQGFWGHATSFDTTFALANNCDSILHVTIKNDVFIKDSITKSICNGEVYFGYNITGYYTDTFHTTSCDSIRVLHLIKSDNLQPMLQQDTSICNGDLVNLYPGSYQKYLWNTGSISASIKVKDIGVYWVEVSDSIGCKARDSFTLINVYAKPTNFLPTTLQVCYGELYTINGFKNYNWITGATTPSINLNGLNSYWLQVTDDNDCKGIDTMKIIYLSNQSINVINAFSPNGDGINDEFKPFTSTCLIQYELLIFNRWGQKVFNTTNVNRGWNGLLNGKSLPTDVYYYIIKYKTVTGLGETKSGYITLLR